MMHTHNFDAPIMTVTQERGRVTVTGEIDLTTRDQFADALRAAISDQSEVVIDITGVTFIDSAGLSVLVIDVAKPLRQANRPPPTVIVLENSGPASVITLGRFNTILNIQTIDNPTQEKNHESR